MVFHIRTIPIFAQPCYQCRPILLRFCTTQSTEHRWRCAAPSPQGNVQYHPRHFESLLGMSRPTTADELLQLLCATNWMCTSIPAYAETIAPLTEIMEKAYYLEGKEQSVPFAKFLSLLRRAPLMMLLSTARNKNSALP